VTDARELAKALREHAHEIRLGDTRLPYSVGLELAATLDRLADIEQTRAADTSELAKRAAEWALVYRWHREQDAYALDVAMICERLVEVEQTRVVGLPNGDIEIWSDGHAHTFSPASALDGHIARIAELEDALRYIRIRIDQTDPCDPAAAAQGHDAVDCIATEALKEKK
jgi:hypothetical protein